MPCEKVAELQAGRSRPSTFRPPSQKAESDAFARCGAGSGLGSCDAFAFVLPEVIMNREAMMPIADTDIDWLACELIEQVPGKVSGRPIIRGTRILPDAIVNSYDAGETLGEIHEDYPGLSEAQIQRLIEFAHARRKQAVS